MLNRKTLAAAAAAITVGCAASAAAQTDVLVVEGTSVGMTSPTTRAGANRTTTIHGARTEAAPAVPLTPLDDARLKGGGAPRAETYLPIKLENAMISSYSLSSGAASPAAPGSMSARQGGTLPIVKDAAGAGSRATPKLMQSSAQGMHVPSAPQRPVADGTSNTLMIGEKHVGQAPAPAIRR
jgi:hypothetical protein